MTNIDLYRIKRERKINKLNGVLREQIHLGIDQNSAPVAEPCLLEINLH